MKKLMTVIAAVAMSFGLYAADATIPHFISFEEADSCVDENGKLQKDGWAGDASVIDLVGGYDYSGADARRDDGFADKGVAGKNVKCLKLETGKEVVTCTLADDTKDIFFDQVVKFTGYEEAPTVTDGKIAVWMSAIEADDQAETPVPGETNLYITCASIALNGEVSTETINLGEYDIDAWHRVTIKSLGNIMADGNRAGFIVYIDGVQVKSIEGIVAEKYLADFAKSYSNSGMLFPALAEGNVATVAYQGIGELDDVAIDDKGPQFARFVEGTVAAINGATLALTNATDMTEIAVDADGKFQVAPGADLLFTYTADEGKFLTGGTLTVTKDGNISKKTDYDFNDEIEAKVAVASYDVEEGVLYTDSLIGAFANTIGNVVLEKNINLTQGAADIIDVPAGFSGEFDLNGYSITRLNTSDYVMVIPDGAEVTLVDNSEEGTGLIKSTPVAAGNTTYPASTIVVKGELILEGAAIEADFCCVKVDEDPGVGVFEMDSGSLKATRADGYEGLIYSVMCWGKAEINDGEISGDIRVLSDNSNKESKAGEITLNDGDFDPFKVFFWAADAEVAGVAKIADEIFASFQGCEITKGEGLQIVEGTAEEGYTTYTLGLIPVTEPVAEIDGEKYTSLAAAFAAAADGKTIKVIADCTIDERINIDGTKSITLDATGKTVTMTAQYPLVMGGADTELGAGTLTIVDGTFVQDVVDGIPVWARRGKINIKGGTFNSKKLNAEVVYSSYSGAVVTIEGGTFTMVNGGDVLNVAQTANPPATEADIVVKGGSFSKDPALGDDYYKGTFVAEGYESNLDEESGLYVVTKKADGPMIDPKHDTAEIKVEGDKATITLKGNNTEAYVIGGLDLTEVDVPVNLKAIRGVKVEAVKVKVGDYDITDAFEIGYGASTGLVNVELTEDKTATVKIGDETIKVTPTIGENVEQSEVKITEGEIAVKAIPGLTYELIRSTKLGDETTAVQADSAKATTTKVELKDKIEEETKPTAAFYQIKVEAK